MRLFFAAWPPAQAATGLAQWAAQLEGRPIPAQNIHLTLAFLGEAQPERAIAAARRVQGRAHTLPIEVAKYWRQSQIVWIGPRETPAALAALVDMLHFELYRAEFALARRPFAAHVTLLRKAPKPKALPPLPKVSWPVEEMVLVSSTTTSKGASYAIVERFPLG